SENIQQKKKEEEKQIAEEQAAKARYWKIPICYDDDEDYTIAITPKEPEDSLKMGAEHLDTIPEKESDEFINRFTVYFNGQIDRQLKPINQQASR
nr:hypothetical protein [Tanacetum cinerariifolium]